MKQKLIKIYKVFGLFLTSIFHFLSRILFRKKKPSVLRFSITNRCNCRCVMCGMWGEENTELSGLTPADINKILKNPLFSELKQVEIIGGEPFTREDIIAVIRQILNCCTSLRSIRIYSNGMLKDNIISCYPKILELCSENQVDCSISFSIDGIGELHDRIRGRKNAFCSLNEILDEMQRLKLDYSLYAVIRKENVDYLFDILNFARDRDVHIDYSIGMAMNSHNSEKEMGECGLTEEGRYTAAKFLEWLYRYYEKDTLKRMYYFALIKQLAYRKKRMSGCIWNVNGISLDSDGNLYYCFKGSEKLCDSRKEDMENAYYQSKEIDDNMRKHCKYCIQDNGGIPTVKLLLLYYYDIIRYVTTEPLKDLFINMVCAILHPILLKNRNKKKSADVLKVYITGWYGTETLGDKAILYHIFKTIQAYDKNAEFYVSSIVPYYTKQTIMQYHGSIHAKVVGRSLKETRKYIKMSDFVVMGGGPLMEIKEMYNIRYAFTIGRLYHKRTVTYGCGLGPFHKEKYQTLARRILELSDYIFLRDQLSINSYPNITKDLRVQVYIDPAAMLLNESNAELDSCLKYNLFCMRELPAVYCQNADAEEGYKSRILNCIRALVFKSLADGRDVIFFPMHTFFIGSDDREFYYQNLYSMYRDNPKVHFYNKDYSYGDALQIFGNAEMVMGMRFHSVVFGYCLGRPVLALDYDEKRGKVSGFMQMVGAEDNVMCLNALSPESAVEKYNIFSKKSSGDKLLIEGIQECFYTDFFDFLSDFESC